jgi:hypothetical protein
LRLAGLDCAKNFWGRRRPIVSGPVEGACKTVVGARLGCSAKRWTRQGGEQVLNPRIRVLSDRDVFRNTYSSTWTGTLTRGIRSIAFPDFRGRLELVEGWREPRVILFPP